MLQAHAQGFARFVDAGSKSFDEMEVALQVGNRAVANLDAEAAAEPVLDEGLVLGGGGRRNFAQNLDGGR